MGTQEWYQVIFSFCFLRSRKFYLNFFFFVYSLLLSHLVSATLSMMDLHWTPLDHPIVAL